ncbi:MAG TPA: carboxylate-amine ligase, partial [Candidatus Dormibacteraeota bacterium]|nr:carboxylate-amine ligase [Candidatus Dormibacteraeota bacterium]
MSRKGLLTIGVEEEYQIIDGSGGLHAHIDTLLAEAAPKLGDKVKREMMQSVVEVGTTICENVDEARQQLADMRGTLSELLKHDGLRLACAGTHPFSSWQEQKITDYERYKMLEEELQDVVRALVIFGLHVHVAIPDPEHRIEVLNEARYFLPHLLALSTSSPFWMGRNTGLKSYRSVIWSNFPRTGIPPDLTSFDEYQNYVDLLVKTGSIDNGKKIWWDLRAHPAFPTLEFRVCDMPTRLEETICLAALMQAICAKLLRLRERNLGFRKYMPALIAENKWRAIRYGIDGQLIDFGK